MKIEGTYNGLSRSVDMHSNFARSPLATRDYARAGVSFVYETRRVLPAQETVEAPVVRRAARRRRRHGSRARAEEDSIAAKGSDLRPAISGAAMAVLLPHY